MAAEGWRDLGCPQELQVTWSCFSDDFWAIFNFAKGPLLGLYIFMFPGLKQILGEGSVM